MFTVPELQLMNYVIQIDSEGKAKNYPISELQVALGTFDALKSCTEEGKTPSERLFKEWNIDFTTEQKALILRSIEWRSFPVWDAEAVFSVQKKLK